MGLQQEMEGTKVKNTDELAHGQRMNGGGKYSTIANRLEVVRQEVQQTEIYSSSSTATSSSQLQRGTRQEQNRSPREASARSVSPRARLQPLDNERAPVSRRETEESNGSIPSLRRPLNGSSSAKETGAQGSSHGHSSNYSQAPFKQTNSHGSAEEVNSVAPQRVAVTQTTGRQEEQGVRAKGSEARSNMGPELNSSLLILQLLEASTNEQSSYSTKTSVEKATRLRDSLRARPKSEQLQADFIQAVRHAYETSFSEAAKSTSGIGVESGRKLSSLWDTSFVRVLRDPLESILSAAERLWMFFDPRYVVVDDTLRLRLSSIQLAKKAFLKLVYEQHRQEGMEVNETSEEAKDRICEAREGLHSHITEILRTWDNYVASSSYSGEIQACDVLEMARTVCNHIADLETRASLLLSLRECFGFIGEGEVELPFDEQALRGQKELNCLARYVDSTLSLLRDMEKASLRTFSFTDMHNTGIFSSAWKEFHSCMDSIGFATMTAASMAKRESTNGSDEDVRQLQEALKLVEKKYATACNVVQLCLQAHYEDQKHKSKVDDALAEEARLHDQLGKTEEEADSIIGKAQDCKEHIVKGGSSTEGIAKDRSKLKLLKELEELYRRLMDALVMAKNLASKTRKTASTEEDKDELPYPQYYPLSQVTGNPREFLDTTQLEKLAEAIRRATTILFDMKRLWAEGIKEGLLRDGKGTDEDVRFFRLVSPLDDMRSGVGRNPITFSEVSRGHRSNAVVLTDPIERSPLVPRQGVRGLIEYPLSLRQAIVVGHFDSVTVALLHGDCQRVSKRLRKLLRAYRAVLSFTKQMHQISRKSIRRKTLVSALRSSTTALKRAESNFPPFISLTSVGLESIRYVNTFAACVREAEMEVAKLVLAYERMITGGGSSRRLLPLLNQNSESMDTRTDSEAALTPRMLNDGSTGSWSPRGHVGVNVQGCSDSDTDGSVKSFPPRVHAAANSSSANGIGALSPVDELAANDGKGPKRPTQPYKEKNRDSRSIRDRRKVVHNSK
eukprot:gb/GECG01008672.1/.p1 GENE.gb/GECG01008672.1/~~gb/GECG01008672.1/.p1  ORF type:complete len:1017 (+),score=130.71 gb/GECG01008672.1/:1-3051(+)